MNCAALKGRQTQHTAAPVCSGIGLLPTYEGGKAVRCAQEATSLCKAAGKAAVTFDQTAPQTLASQHQHFDAAFNDCITASFNKVTASNC